MTAQAAEGSDPVSVGGVYRARSLSPHYGSNLLGPPLHYGEASGPSQPNASSPKTVDILGTQVTQPPDRSPQLGQPSLFDNYFEPSEDFKSQSSIPPSHHRSPSPHLVIARPDGQIKAVGDEDFEDPRVSGSDTDLSSIKSLEPIDDLGFRDLTEPAATTHIPLRQTLGTDIIPEPSLGEDLSRTSSAKSPIAFAGSSFEESDDPIRNAEDFAKNAVLAEDDAEKYEIQNLDDALRNACRSSVVNDTQFLPLGELWRIFNASCAREVLRNHIRVEAGEDTERKLDKYVREICGPDPNLPSTGRRKILAILVLMDNVESIFDFIKAGVIDLHLPLTGIYHKGSRTYELVKKKEPALKHAREGEHDNSHSKDAEPELTNPRFRCCGWSRRDWDYFKTYQPRMLAPYLRRNSGKLPFYKMSDEAVLPFLEWERRSDGGYGTVYRVRIHKDHHELEPPLKHTGHDIPYYAVKKLHFGNEKDFHRELMVLEKFSGDQRGDEHLIRLLLTYTHRKDYYLLFHWADCNLKELWRNHPEVDISHDNCRWIIKQCLGIAVGLRKIHRVADSFHEDKHGNNLALPTAHNQGGAKKWGRHGDIKPENILWFKQLNRLVISDFGLSQFHSQYSVSTDPYDSLLGFSQTYRAPECDLRVNINQKYDIWALGCVYLEFISWFVLGDTIDEFATARVVDESDVIQEDKFFIVDGSEAKVKDSVIKWMNKIRSSPKCTLFILQFVDMIERNLLVPAVKDRKYCEEVTDELRCLQRRCDESQAYCERPISQPEPLIYKGKGPEQPAQQSLTSVTGLMQRVLPRVHPGIRDPETMEAAGYKTSSGGRGPDPHEQSRFPPPSSPADNTSHATTQNQSQELDNSQAQPLPTSNITGSQDFSTDEIREERREKSHGEVSIAQSRRNRRTDATANQRQPLQPSYSTLYTSEDSIDARHNYSRDTTMDNSIQSLPPKPATLKPEVEAPPQQITSPAPLPLHQDWDDKHQDGDDAYRNNTDRQDTSDEGQRGQLQHEEPSIEAASAGGARTTLSSGDPEQASQRGGVTSSHGEEAASTRGLLSPRLGTSNQHLQPHSDHHNPRSDRTLDGGGSSHTNGSHSLAGGSGSEMVGNSGEKQPDHRSGGGTPSSGAVETDAHKPRSKREYFFALFEACNCFNPKS